MLPSRSKKHHYLPVGFQRRFIEGYGELFYSKRDEAGKFSSASSRNPANIFFKRNHNTRYEDGQPTDVVEKELYGTVDDKLCKLVDEIRPLIRRGENFNISDTSDFTLRIIFIEMMRRVPEAQKNFADSYHSNLRSIQSDLLQRYPERGSEIRRVVEARNNDRSEMQNVKLQVRTHYPERLLQGMEGMLFRFALLPDNAMFILSSNMIQRLSNGGDGNLHDALTELWFPIDPHIAIVAARVPANFPKFVYKDRKFAKEYNDLAVSRSDEVGSPSSKLLSALIRRRMR
tara:strand:- start:571 stop:1431 length:861 start_codon:yes stop_codon:yes gene_type:complete